MGYLNYKSPSHLKTLQQTFGNIHELGDYFGKIYELGHYFGDFL